LSSPWDLALSPARDTLYVAMAGTHQVWRIDTVAGTAAAYAGTGIEGLKDGPVSDAEFAQPSGLCFAPIDPAGAPAPTMSFLYVADPESSSIRAINLQTDTVTTIVGHGLADFGDVDQTFPRTRLQHCLGVAAIARPDGGDDLLVADTYNHKIKRLDLRARVSSTLAGSVRNDPADASEGSAPRFNEPGGISVAGTGDAARVFVADTNDHSIILFDPNTQTGRPLRVENLAPRP
jgi:DNA-binding beta-propeller fold protein YncE